MEVRNLLGLMAFVVTASSLAPAPCAAEEAVTDPPQLAISPSWAHALLPRSVSSEGIGLALAFNPGGRVARAGASRSRW